MIFDDDDVDDDDDDDNDNDTSLYDDNLVCTDVNDDMMI